LRHKLPDRCLAAIRAAAARDGLYDLDLVAGLVLDQVADVDETLVAGARPLFSGLVWVIGTCGRVLDVHSDLLRLWAGARERP